MEPAKSKSPSVKKKPPPPSTPPATSPSPTPSPAPSTSAPVSKGKKSDRDQKKPKKGKSGESTDGKQRQGSYERSQPKDLKSGPLYEKGVVALTAKVKGRKPPKKKRSGSKSREDISYPLKKSGRKTKVDSDDEVGQSTILNYDTCAESETEVVSEKTLPYSGMPILTNNKCNNNQLFIDNMPFWWSNETSEITDDELVMNATVIIDVLENRLKLVPMPDIRIILDPVEDVTVLQARNAQCFTKDIIFGNTVRSMVNLNELSIRTLQGTSKKVKKKIRAPGADHVQSLSIVEPTSLTVYSREDFNERYTEDYSPIKTIRIASNAQIDSEQ